MLVLLLACLTDAPMPVVGVANASISPGTDLLSRQFSEFVQQKHSITLPQDFLELCVQAMSHLRQCGRSNVLYSLAKGLGTLRPDKSDTKFPAKRMPTGLLQYMVEFFAADNFSQVYTSMRWLCALSSKDFIIAFTGSTLPS